MSSAAKTIELPIFLLRPASRSPFELQISPPKYGKPGLEVVAPSISRDGARPNQFPERFLGLLWNMGQVAKNSMALSLMDSIISAE